jgi:hypothetical protein
MSRCFSLATLMAVVLMTSMLCVSTVEACPTCKDAMVHSNQQGIQLGYYWSILFMMSMPFSIFGGWMFYIWRVCRYRTHAMVLGNSAPAKIDDIER